MNTPEVFLFRRRRWILGVWLLLTALGTTVLLARFQIDNSVGVWFPKNDPALQAYEAYLDAFGAYDWTLLMLETASNQDPDTKFDLIDLSMRLSDQEHVHRVLPGSKLFPEIDHENKTVLLLETDNLIERQDRYRWTMLQDIETAVAQTPSVTQHWITGTAVLNAELNRSARRDMFVFIGLVSLLVTALCLGLLRSWRDTLVVMAVSLSNAAITLGAIALCGYSFNILTIMLPTVLIAISVADTIHVVHAFHQRRRTDSLPEAVRNVLAELWRPCFGTSATTSVGFLSLATSSVLPIFQIAIFCALGITLAWGLSLIVGPALLAVLWGSRARRRSLNLSGPIPWLTWLQASHRRPIRILCVFLLLAVGLSGLTRLEADTDYVAFFRPSSAVPKAYAAVQDAGYPQSSLMLLFDRDPSDKNLPAWQEFLAEVDRLPDVNAILAPHTPSVQLVAGVSPDKKWHRMITLTPYLSSKGVRALEQEILHLQRKHLPTAQPTVTGTAVLWSGMDSSIITTQKRSVAIVLIAMLVVLVLIARSFLLGVLGWLVSIFPVTLILGVMGLLGVKVNMGTVLIAGITAGLAVDATIHLLYYYRMGLKSGQASDFAMEGSISDVGTRILLTTLIVMGGFACMSVSSFQPSAEFGIFTCITILLAAITVLVLFPVLIRLVQSPRSRTIESIRREASQT